VSVRSRLRPFHALLAAVVVCGTAASLWRVRPAFGPVVVLVAVAQGLLAAIVVQFTVGAVWDYLRAYRDAGGELTEAPVFAPVACAVGTAVGVYATTGRPGSAAWTAFWAFVVVAAVAALAVQVRVGYERA
jgi:hypothetical protein